MQRRTLATFLRVWQDRPTVQFASWPTFVPRLERSADGVTIAGAPGALWPLERFMSLLLGRSRACATMSGVTGRAGAILSPMSPFPIRWRPPLRGWRRRWGALWLPAGLSELPRG